MYMYTYLLCEFAPCSVELVLFDCQLTSEGRTQRVLVLGLKGRGVSNENCCMLGMCRQ